MNIFNPLVSGSLSVSGSGQVSGDLTVLGTLFATISGTAQNAISTSHAASYLLTSSFETRTGSFATTGSNYFKGEQTFSGSLIPSGSELFDLGSSTNRWRDIFLAGSTINLGGTKLTKDGSGNIEIKDSNNNLKNVIASEVQIGEGDNAIIIKRDPSTGYFRLAGQTQPYIAAQLSGSFTGSGAGLYDIPASGVTGLNLNQISDGSATASISQVNGLLINTNTEITGNLKVNNINVGTNELVTISVTDAGGKYFIDNVRNPQLTLVKGFTYKFLFPNIGSHPLKFSTTNDGSHNGGTIYSTGVTTGATPNYIQIEVTDSTPSTLYYYCTVHPGMGSSISVVSDILNLEADRGVVYIDPARIATTGSNSLTGLQTISGSLSVTGSVDITGSMSLNGQPIGTGKLDETVFNTYTSSNDNKVSALETSSGSLNVFTSSIEQFTGSVNGKLNSLESSTSSLYSFTSSANSILSSLESASGSIRTDFNSYTSSNDSTNTTQNSRLSSLEGASGSIRTDFNSYTSSNGTTNTTQNDKLSALETTSGSINSYTSSNIANINAIHIATSSLNTFSSSVLGAVEITGSNLTVKGNLLVKGTTTQIDSTTLNIGDNIIQLNGTAASNAGLVVQDASGASIISGSLLWDSATDNWKAGKLGSEERIILVNEYNTFSTSIDSRASSIQTATASLNSYTASNNTRLDVIETTTGSLNSFTSSTNSKLNSLESASSSIISDFNGYTSSNNTRLGVIESTTSSLNSYTSSNNTRLGVIESTTGSLNSFTSSANSRLNSLESASSSIRTDFNSYTSSTNSTINAIHTSTSSLNSYTSSNNTRLGTIESTTGSLNTYTSSANTRFNTIESTTASLNSFTNSINTTIKDRLNVESIISGSAQVTLSNTTGYSTFSSSLATTDAGQDNRLSSIEGKTGSYATTGSNIFIGNQTITGSLYISQDLIVAGSSSIQHISSSVVNIADNIITVNAQNPAVRFGGLAVIDSGSSPQVSGSLLFDATENEWIFVHQNQTAVTSALLIMGPETYNDIGNEIHLTNNRLVKSTIDEHVGDSNITDTGTKVSINSNTEITGTLAVTQNISSPNITAIQIATGSLNNFSSSILTAIELTGSNLTVKGNLLVKGTTTNVNVTTLDVDNNLINLNGTGATNAGLRVKDTTGPNQVSGSLLWDASNDYWIAGQLGSEQRIVRETEFNNAVTRIGNVETSTGSLNSYTSSTNTRLGVIESTTSSLNTYTSSTNNRLGSIETSTGSLNTFTSSASGRISAIESTTASLNSYTSSNTTNINAIHTATASLNNYTSSNTTNINAIHTATSSLNSYTSSNTTAINAINTATSSLNTFTSSFNSAFSLSGADVTVRGNFTVSGTTTTVNSTTVNIADNIIQLNGTGATNAGLVVRDATASTLTSGSLLWDTSNDKWIAGPLGSEDDIVLRTTSQTLTNKTISGASNTLSNIGNSSLTNSSITIAGTSTSLGGSITAATILSGTGVVSGSAQLTSTFVQKGGDSMSGQLIIASTGTAGAATLKVNTSTATSFIHSQENFSVNMTAGQTNILVVGQAGSTKNAGYLGYNWSSSASNSNYVSLGHWGADNLLRVYGDGTVYMGTVTTGVWNGSSIGTAYTDAKVTSVSAGTGISVNATTGAVTVTNSGVTSIAGTTNQITASASTGGVTLSLPQNIHTSAVPTFKAITLTSDTDSRVLNLRELGSTSGNIIQFQTSAGINTWEIVGRSASGATPFYIYKNSGTNTGYIFSISDGGIPNFHTALTVGGSTVYHTGNIPTWNQNTTGTAANITASSNTSLTSLSNLATVGTITSGVWNGSSISTTYTDAKVTSVSAGTGVSVNQTTGAVTVSIGQAVATSSSPTFADTTLTGGLTIGGSLTRGTYTTASNYVIGADNIVLKGNSSGVSGIFFESEKDGTNINHPSDFAFIQFHSYGIGGSSGEANRLVIGASNDADDLIVLNPMATDGVKVRVGAGTTEYTVYHSGNLTNLNQLTNGPAYISGNQTITISGDASGSGATSISLTVSQIQGRAFRNTGSNDGVNANSLDANGTTYVTNVDGSSTNLTGNATDGALYSQVYSSSWQHQIYGDYRTGIMYARGKNNGTWQSWKRVALSNSTTFSNVSSVSFTHNLGTANLTAQVFDSSNNMFFPSEINITSTTVTVTFAANRTGRLVVTG